MFPRLQTGTYNIFAGKTHSVINWHRSVSWADANERNTILGAINAYHQQTSIRFKDYDPNTDRDYIHITGENSGCWSYVGRLGGVSNRIHCVVKASTALRTAPFGFHSPPKTQNKFGSPLAIRTSQIILETFCPNCSNSRTIFEFTIDHPMDADSWLWNLVQQISVCVLKSVFGTSRWLWDCATVCLCYTAVCTAVKVATKYEFVYVSVRPKTWHTFFFNTSQSLYKMRVVYYITCKALLLSLPSITSCQ